MSGFASIARPVGAGGTDIANASATSQFGEVLVSQLEASAQATFVYGINATQFITGTYGTSALVTAVSGNAIIESGTTTTGSAGVRMRRGSSYRAGQGTLFRGTAIFGPPVANTYQLIGLGNVESGYYFGYSGTNFGIHHFPGSFREIRKLTISAGVADGTSVTVTLNGEAKAYTITGGGTVNQTSWEISQQNWTQVGGGWQAEAYDGSVYFIALRPGVRTGSYSATGVGLTATFSQYIAGTSTSPTFISQSQWNIDTMDGTGPSRFVLNPAKGNVYQVGFQYLGFGNARFSIEDSQTGQFQACHMIRNANSRLTPVLKDPHVTGLWSVANAGSTTSTHMTGTSGAIFTEGKTLKNIGPAFSAYASNSDVDTAEEPIFSIRADQIFDTNVGFGEISLNTLTAAVLGTAGAHYVIFRVYKNLRLSGPVNFINVDSTKSFAAKDVAATGFTTNNSSLIATYVVSAGNNIAVNLNTDGFTLNSGDIMTLTGEASTNNIAVAAAISWFEDR